MPKRIRSPLSFPRDSCTNQTFSPATRSKTGSTSLPFKAYDYPGFTAKPSCRPAWVNYDLTSCKATSAMPIPDFLFGVRERAAALAGISADAIVQAMVTEYPPGALIGWPPRRAAIRNAHRDLAGQGGALAPKATQLRKGNRFPSTWSRALFERDCPDQISAPHSRRGAFTLFDNFQDFAFQSSPLVILIPLR